MTRFVSRRNTYESRLQVPYSQQFKFYRLVKSKKISKFALHNKQRHTYRVDIHKRFAIGLLERNLAISTNHQQPALDACIPWVQADLWNRTGDWACQSLSKERENGEAGILCFIPSPMVDANLSDCISIAREYQSVPGRPLQRSAFFLRFSC